MNILLGLAIASLAMLAASCSSPAEEAENVEQQVDKKLNELDKAMAQDIERDRAVMTEDLRILRIRIADKLVEVEAKLASKGLKANERAELETLRTELVDQRDRIDRNLSAVGLATRDTWNDVKRGIEEVRKDVDGWFHRQAEKVDKKTKGDKDGDGH